MSEIFFNERYADFLNSSDETESDALGVLSSLLSQIELAKKVSLPEVNVPELIILMAKVEVLFAQYKMLKETSSHLYVRYQEEKQSFLEELEQKAGESDVLTSEERKKMAQVIKIRALAHTFSMAKLAPAAVIMAIKRSKEFTDAHAINVRRDLSSYRLVEVEGSGQRLKTTATTERLDDQLVETLRVNEGLNTVLVNAPPGSGKTTLLNNIELRLRQEGWEVIQINFDKVIAEFFKFLQQETMQWSKLIAEEFDSSFFNLEQELEKYYPEEFNNKRVIVLIDALGYRIDNMNYGLWLIRKLLKDLIEDNKAMVITVIPQPAIVEKTKRQREDIAIGSANAKDAHAALKKSQGAPARAVIRHHEELDKKVKEAQAEKEFQKIYKRSDLKVLEGLVPVEQLEQMKERLAYAILTRNILRIFKNWWFAFNLFREEGQDLAFPEEK